MVNICGIAGIYFKGSPHTMGISQPRIEAFVDALLEGIEHRGKHATGVVSARGRKARMEKMPKPATEFIKGRRRILKDPRTVLLHTRWATQGDPKIPMNNHPVKYESVYAIHNGHVSNDDELFPLHGLGRKAQVDSEIISALFYKYGLEKAHLAMQELQGGIATAVIDPRRSPNTLVIAKGESSPCVVFENEMMIVWASELRAIDDAFVEVFGAKTKWESTKYLQQGKMLLINGKDVEELEYQVNHRYNFNHNHNYEYSDYTRYFDSRRTTKNTKVETCETKTDTGASALNEHPDLYKPLNDHPDLYKRCAKCNCERYWHSGELCDGECYGEINEKLCECKSFQYIVGDKKQITTGKPTTVPDYSVQSAGARYTVEYAENGSRTVNKTMDDGSTVIYGVCINCDAAFEKDSMNQIYTMLFCTKCYEDTLHEDKSKDESVPAPELVQLMVGNVVEEIGEDSDDETEDVVNLTVEIEDEVLAGTDDISYVLDDLRAETIERTAEDIGVEEEVVEWLMFEVDEEERQDETTAFYYDTCALYYKENMTAIIEELRVSQEHDRSDLGVQAFEVEI